jgi:putative pyruvate formate lyase activating enzyme
VYVKLLENGVLAQRAAAAWDMLRACTVCPRACGVDRTAGEVGACGAGANPAVSSFNVHNGEEPPISGSRGSGAIFMTHCNLACIFCQNYPISQMGNGRQVTCERLAEMMLSLQQRGCHNINFVTPTHFMPQILTSVLLAARQGLRLPLVWNSSGYDGLDALRLLDGVIDIYMPDSKYGDDASALKYSNAPDYVRHNRAALREMHRQAGVLQLDQNGIAARGLIIRHLVLPGNASGSDAVLDFIATQLGADVFMSIMDQYFPAHRAASFPEMNRSITREEYEAVLDAAERHGLDQGWIQGGY